MKKSHIYLTSFFVTVLFAFYSNAALCQQKKRNTQDKVAGTVVSIYPTQFIFSTFKVGIEKPITNKITVKGVGSLGLNEHSDFYDADNYAAFSAEGQLRYFPMQKAPAGFYGGIYFYDRNASFEQYQTSYNLNALGTGVLFGVQVFAGQIISFDFYGGGGPNIPLSKGAKTDLTNDFEGNLLDIAYRKAIAFHGGVSIGLVLK